LLALLIKTFSLIDLMVRSMTIDGAIAAVHWRANVHSRITGATVPTELIDIVEVRENCIVNFKEVFVSPQPSDVAQESNGGRPPRSHPRYRLPEALTYSHGSFGPVRAASR
jgi:hypothetical protein